jgi:methylenetetrahydrofolate reductase (NADPH)
VTFGAGGSTREGTLATVLEIRAEGLPPRRTFRVGASRASLRDVLTHYRSHGIRHLVALRGDQPSGSGDTGDFRYASELVAFIREETGDWFTSMSRPIRNITRRRGVATTISRASSARPAGADSAITQYFSMRMRTGTRGRRPRAASQRQSFRASCP